MERHACIHLCFYHRMLRAHGKSFALLRATETPRQKLSTPEQSTFSLQAEEGSKVEDWKLCSGAQAVKKPLPWLPRLQESNGLLGGGRLRRKLFLSLLLRERCWALCSVSITLHRAPSPSHVRLSLGKLWAESKVKYLRPFQPVNSQALGLHFLFRKS